ncbi:MAG: CHAT domain-containing protein [Mycobacterium leprae]
MSALRSAVGRTAKSHPEWSGRAINLGNALTQLYEVTNQAESLDEAVDLLEEAVRRASAPSERSLRLSALSRSLRVRHEARGDRADLERSVELDAEALSATPPGNSNGMLLLNNLANGLSLLSDGRDQQWKRAVEAWREVCRYGTPAVALMAALTWLDRALTRDVPEDGTDAADLAQVALDRLVSVQEHRREQENWLRMADHLPAMAAQVNVAVGNPEHAVLAVERSRASLFTKQLLGSTTSDLTFAQLQGFASAQAPLAYLVPGDHPLALIVDSAGVSVVDLPELTENAVQQALSRFYWGYYHREADRERWPRAFDEVTRWLWAAAMEPLLAALPGYPEVQLLPGGQLALLPLHAAWEVDSSRPTGRRYACDEVVITLLPNAQLPLQHTTPPRTTRGRLLTVADPQPTSERSLRLAVTEAHGASVAFDHVEHLAQKDATPQRVLAAARTADVLHFACHGRMKMDDPRASGLILADDQVLTVGAVLDAHLDARLIVASACESGFVAPQLPNEVVSLAAALLFAGARAVLATAFTVDDLSALLLTSRFYAEWGPDTPGPQAVQKATRFLRDTTNAEKLAWVEHLHRSGWPPVVTEALRGVLGFTNPDERSFASPVQWAAFTWWGQHVAP